MYRNNFLSIARGLVEAYDEYMKPACREFGIPLTSLTILLFVAKHPNSTTAIDIVRHHAIKANLVSLHVAKLVYDGYLERLSVQGDRRKINLICTEKAQSVIKRGLEYQKRFYESLTKGISEDEIEEFNRCLSVLLDNAANISAPTAEVL